MSPSLKYRLSLLIVNIPFKERGDSERDASVFKHATSERHRGKLRFPL